MNKKILMLTLMLLVMLTLSIIPVQAAPKEKLDFKLYHEGPPAFDYGPKSHAGPVGSEDGAENPKEWVQRTFHAREGAYTIWFANLTIGDVDYFEMYVNCTVISVTSFEFNWKTLIGTFRSTETITFDEIEGTIEILVRDKLNYASFTSEGTIVGHGTGDLKGVKIVGTTSGEAEWTEIAPGVWVPTKMKIIREGTIMGWPTD
jgi:hypothetical protein